MAGKAPSRGRRERGHTSRPYDRPNQSLLGKVASTVKGLFTPSTWLFSIPNWARGQEGEEDSSSYPVPTTEPDLTENEDEAEELPIRPKLSTRSKRPRIEPDTGLVANEQASQPFWLAPSTSRDNLSDKIDVSESPVIGSCQINQKETPVVVNGDDQSENSDGSASTSGCSSLISSQDKPHRSGGLKLSESALEHLRSELKNKPAFQRPKKDVSIATDSLLNNSSGNMTLNNLSLWSCDAQALGRSPQRPSLIGNRPSFNVSSFGTPSKEASTSKIASPFYEGSTMYGGASSYRRRQMPAVPYQRNPTKILKSQVKVKENQAGEEFECMSAAAKRILHTLEKMSTPVMDAKRIPNIGTSPLDIPLTVTPPSQRFKSYLSISRRSPVPSPKAPPIVNLNSISKVTLLKNHQSRLSRMDIPLREQPMVPLQEPPSVSSTPPSTTPRSPGSSGGKMKTKRRESLHAPAKAKEAQDDHAWQEQYELPDVPLPVKNIPVISFDLKPRPSIRSAPEPKLTTDENELSFTFSKPIEYSTPAVILEQEKSGGNAFRFSSPLVATSKASETSAFEGKSREASDAIITNGSVEDILRRMKEKSNNRQADDVDDAKKDSSKSSKNENSTGEQSQIASGFGDAFKPKPGSWSCGTCFVQNDESSKRCVACETQKPAAEKEFSTPAPLIPSGFGDKFKPKPGSWSCTTCFVQNEESSKACVACETPRSSSDKAPPPPANALLCSLIANFQHKPGSWECPTCMIRNKEEDAKCVACETPNPTGSQKKASGEPSFFGKAEEKDKTSKSWTSEGGNLVQLNQGTWECDTCLVRNSLDKSKCIACETLRNSKNGNQTGNTSTAFKFGMPEQKTSGFKFASLTSNTSVTASTFKFGVSSESQKFPLSSSSSTTTTSAFKFGMPADSEKASISSSPAFKFGMPADVSKAPAENNFKFGMPADAPKASAENNFKFGMPADAPKAPAESNFKFGVPAAESQKSTSDTVQNVFGSTGFGSASSVSFKFGTPVEAAKTSVPATINIGDSDKSSGTENVTKSGQSSIPAGFSFPSGSSKLATADKLKSLFSESYSSQADTPKSSVESKATESSEFTKAAQEPSAECVTTCATSTENATSVTASGPLKADLFKFGSSSASGATTTSSSIGSGGFRFEPSTTVTAATTTRAFGSSPFGGGGGIKLGGQKVEELKMSPASALGLFKTNPAVSESTSVSTAKDSSINAIPFHSKPSADGQPQSAVPSFASGLSKPTPLTFGSSSGTAPTSDANRTSIPSGGFGIFGSATSQQPSAFKMGDTATSVSKNENMMFRAPQPTQAGGAPVVTFSSPFSLSASASVSKQSNVNVTGQAEVKTSVPSQGFSLGTLQPTPASAASTSVTPSLFAFGNTSTSANPMTSTSVFGAAVTSSGSGSGSINTSLKVDSNAQKTPNVFKFGESSTGEAKTFGSSGFTFNREAEDKSSVFAPAAKMAFGSTPFKSESTGGGSLPLATPLQFGATTQAPSGGGFVFGAPAKTFDASQPAPQFSFGSGAANKPPAFTGFQSSQPSGGAAPSMPVFNFGTSNVSTATTSAAPAFSAPSGNSMFTFGVKSGTQPPAASNPTSVFGAPSQQLQQPVFGSGSTGTPAFGGMSTFGSIAPAKPEASGGFSFGAPASMAQPQQSSVFVFGATAEKKPAGTPQATGFNFSMPPQFEGGTAYRPNFSLSPQSFNFGATASSTPTNPFQFQAANSESGASPASATQQRRVRKAVRRSTRKPD